MRFFFFSPFSSTAVLRPFDEERKFHPERREKWRAEVNGCWFQDSKQGFRDP